MRWWQLKVVGHPTQHELECRTYDKTMDHDYEAKVEGWQRRFHNEYLGEPIPPEAVERHVIPCSRSVGKSEDIMPRAVVNLRALAKLRFFD